MVPLPDVPPGAVIVIAGSRLLVLAIPGEKKGAMPPQETLILRDLFWTTYKEAWKQAFRQIS